MVAGLVLVAGGLCLSATPAAAATLDVRTVCTASQTTGTTITLTADCATTDNLTVPDGFTLDGAGHTISASNPAGGILSGAVLANAGATMNVQNLTVTGNFPEPANETQPIDGIAFTAASGSLTNVTVTGITRHNTFNYGRAVIVNATTGGHQTVTVTNVTIRDFQKNGLSANGDATMNVTGSTLGPPDTTINTPGAPFTIAQNSVQYFGSGGTFSGNTVIAFTSSQAVSASTGMLLFSAHALTISGNTFGGAGTDYAILLSSGSNDITISGNQIARTATPTGLTNNFDTGVQAFDTSTATLICNTFSGWNRNLVNLSQPPCITTETLPGGTVGQPFSSPVDATTENPDPSLTWSVIGGTLPPGLTLAPDGTLTGAPTTPGTFTFTIQVADPVDGTSTREFTIVVAAPPPSPSPSEPAAEAETGEVLGPSVATGGYGVQAAPDSREWQAALPVTGAGVLLLALVVSAWLRTTRVRSATRRQR